MWTVTRIDEADFGCEERMPGEPLRVLVTIRCEDGRISRFECAQDWLLSQGIEEGDEWPEDIPGMEEAEERASQMSQWMEHYYELVSETEE